jgi:hypothetical protein
MALPVVFTPGFNGPAVSTWQLPPATANSYYQAILSATGGTPPYKWHPAGNHFAESHFDETLVPLTENLVLPDNGSTERKTVSLPFDFSYHGRSYREITITGRGGIILEENKVNIPYGLELRELLGLNRAIYPFYSTELQYTDSTDGVYYEAHKIDVTIYWNASLVRNGITSDVNFAARLFDNGTIDFLYGDFANTTSVPWLSGLTGGSKAQSLFPDINATGITPGRNIRFEPYLLPGGFQISIDGVLSCIPTEYGKTWPFQVTVEDQQGLQSTAMLALTTGSDGIAIATVIPPEVRIFPNPVTDQAFIEVVSNRGGTIEVTVNDLTGKLITMQKYPIPSGSSIVRLATPAQMVPGLYIVQITGAATFRSKIYFSPSK